MENPNLRISAYLALRHPFISKKSNNAIENLPPVFDSEKIAEDSNTLRVSLKKILLLAFIKKNMPERKVITIYRTDPSKIQITLSEGDNQDPQADFHQKRNFHLSSSVIGESSKKLQIIRPQRTFNVLAEHFATEGNNRSTYLPNSSLVYPESEGKLPCIDILKKEFILPQQFSSQTSDSPEKKHLYQVSSNLTQWTKAMPSDSPKRRDKQIKDILERIVLKEKESIHLSQSVYKKVTEGATFSRTKTIDQKTPVNKNGYRRDPSLNFTSARPSNQTKVEEGLITIRPKNPVEQSIFELKQLNFAERLKIKDKDLGRLSRVHKTYKLTSSKIKVPSQLSPSKTVGQQEGVTISTQDY